VIDRTGQTWRITNGGTYLFVRSWSVPKGTCHEVVSVEEGTSEEWEESSDHGGPLEWRAGWQRLA